VVHIASHGKFSDHIEGSFILTADDRLTFDKLSDFVGLYRFRENPLELITLSACETASGNEQAALGLAGLSIKIGARSALATLWAVEDEAAAQLVPEFYRQLKTKNTSRAIALKKAKLKILKDPVYGHPGYWAPFVLINNWL
jgi:CHAT domain-containing protein